MSALFGAAAMAFGLSALWFAEASGREGGESLFRFAAAGLLALMAVMQYLATV